MLYGIGHRHMGCSRRSPLLREPGIGTPTRKVRASGTPPRMPEERRSGVTPASAAWGPPTPRAVIRLRDVLRDRGGMLHMERFAPQKSCIELAPVRR